MGPVIPAAGFLMRVAAGISGKLRGFAYVIS
ncbi:hypothetical protein HCH_05126 [Hahella chejuensis KCTC 2396]|uniref:Uncharacterized protein n=1 Tax=Hahella chejuensis (strain KCTC 2396) TaxID=349521 RepID=Q2SC18_HAHCH|nr:hypothetical protein HCH_05126 [Hahella chejuensis KCTC 2396]